MYTFKLILLLFLHKINSAIVENEAKRVFYNIEDANELFDSFIEEFGKVYKTTDEYEYRLKVFTENLVKINEYNKNYDVVFGITQFMDSTEQEFKEKTAVLKHNPFEDIDIETFDLTSIGYDDDIPSSWDWRDSQIPVVSPVGDQAQCGACWAFSIAGNIEGLYARKYQELKVFSKQEILDCSYPEGGCSGGEIYKAMQGIAKKGIVEETEYPYKAIKGNCKLDETKVNINITGGFQFEVPYEQEDFLLTFLVYKFGPIVASIQANEKFGYYKGGIANNKTMNCKVNNKQLDHAVLLVGYGEENGTPYWIIKNSFGDKWGEKGYIRFVRNQNTCSITNGLFTIIDVYNLR